MKEKVVSEYMSKDVVKLNPNDTKGKFIEKLEDTGHTGYPVCRDDMFLGYVTAKSILLSENDKISYVDYQERPTVSPDCNLNKASRIMSRNIIHELPVTDGKDKLVGIISNLDIIRSQIERTQIEKVEKIISTYEKIYDIECEYKERSVEIQDLKPTQSKITRNELKARKHELNNNTAEPIVVIDNDTNLIIIDGHHRVVAAKKLGLEEVKAYKIEIDNKNIKIRDNAKDQGVYTINDIKVDA